MARGVVAGNSMIPIHNLYYMLAYAFRVLQEREYVKCAAEAFENAADLLAAILCKGIAIQVRRGLGRDYQNETAPLMCLRGKVELTASMQPKHLLQQRMVCSFDEFTTDCYLNRILKTTMVWLLKCKIAIERKKQLRNLLLYFEGVEVLEHAHINWGCRFNRNNQSYQMLVAICKLVLTGMIQSKREGTIELLDFDDEHKARLYERFILEYYRKHFPELNASAQHIDWAIMDGEDDGFLPQMRSDITLSKGNKILIIDAKYYAENAQSRYDTPKARSAHLYQIFTYVKNKQVAFPEAEVSGMLLYAKTAEDFQPQSQYTLSGNKFILRTLDLNCPFEALANQLNVIAQSFPPRS
ncbi:MAG: 5-methylcytosine-specific restriction endonuclease system specificity protein McrC [bacterium]|nr:5-methylcytosine-specific restriction endonuclease system specificity protein McrC [bacterium]